ncbi:peptide/nickel transport system substrate-binding protein [Microlunatus soli]|uniref:Peptide/nickel transport system substrate-binding protein n=2 Tax=Microlunatus soli TaxID=630515 RepID=A0A1H1ZIW0_9ACTN|nr:ABC transporter substrate-binding protein [Microlunatus soli]SDT33497.1 peptide/nickel transport system substrate-binding protein [Microlunatus soli]
MLYGSAIIAGAAALAGCSHGASAPDSGASSSSDARGSETKALRKPGRYRQAPNLPADLPPVEERLPDNPYVVPHRWIRQGKYGGRLNMNVLSTSGAAAASSDREFFYGHSLLRFLNDGLDIGPGIAESWESNDDASEWIFHLRKGLKWSDGHDFTSADIMFWWDEFILAGKMGQSVPDEARSGRGTIAKVSASDDHTLKISFDAPAPLTADRIVSWVNGGIGQNGPIWVLPSHYLKQFHPKYGKNVPKDWDTVGGLMERKADWHRNPDCPTLIGYRCKSFDADKGVVLERNPYYYAVTPDGDQLPYIDEIQFTVIADAEAGKLQVQQGSVDFCLGYFNQIALTDVDGLRKSSTKAGTQIRLWDSGSGTGSMFFLNYDYIDDDLRQLFRNPAFRQAISYAFDRQVIRKSLYFNTGELTTGTMSPKGAEFHADTAGETSYRTWRDSYVDHDPAKASALLDEIGCKRSEDGMRRLPNGKPLKLRLDYSADESAEHKAKDNQLVSDLKAVGIAMELNPVPPQAYDDQWKSGKLMAHSNWEVGGAPRLLAQPQFIVPIEYTRWAPLEGQWYQQLGTKTNATELDVDPWQRHPPRMPPEKGGPIARLWELYDASKTQPDSMKRDQAVWEMIKIHVSDGPFFMGCVANYPQVVVVKKGLQNVPTKANLAQGGFVNPWIHPTPAVYDPECWFWDQPDDHGD